MIKKILIDARMYGLENTGIGRYLINLTEELKKLKTEIHYVILLRKKYFDQLNLPGNWKKILADFGHYSFEEQIKLPKLIKSENPDLVHFPHLNIPIFWKGKFVVTVHDLTMQKQKTDATTLPLPIYYLKRLPFLLTSRVAVKKSVGIIAPTNAVKDDISDYYKVDKSKIKVVYEGLTKLTILSDPSNSKMILEKYKITKPYFIYIGNAYPHKNLKKAIEAIIILNNKLKTKISLVIGGSRNIFTKRLQNNVKELNAEDYVNLIGFAEENELSTLYKNSLGFVYPSIAEGYGLQGLESMEAGTVVLASNISVFKEIYGDNAFYFDPKSANSIAGAMEYVLNLKEQERDKLLEQAKEFIKKYSWSKMANDTLKIYNSFL